MGDNLSVISKFLATFVFSYVFSPRFVNLGVPRVWTQNGTQNAIIFIVFPTLLIDGWKSLCIDGIKNASPQNLRP